MTIDIEQLNNDTVPTTTRECESLDSHHFESGRLLDSGDVNAGLPPLDLSRKPVSFFEFWPAWVLYIPIVVYWIFLSIRFRNFGLPMAVNPNIPLGGMVGESKLEILKSAGDTAHQHILSYIEGSLQNCDASTGAHVDNEIARAEENGIHLPFIVKPELGCRGAGVRRIKTRDDLVSYLEQFPKDRSYIIQRLAPYSAEAGVFYERDPDEQEGRVTSITLKYRPFVLGDGISSLRTLICKDKRASILRDLYFSKNAARLNDIPALGEQVPLAFAGSHCRGSIFRNGNAHITPELSKKIDRIMQDFPEFYYGRLDLKFKDIASLEAGEAFTIIEVNGVSSEKTHIWDSRTSLWEAISTLFEQYTTLFKMGHKLRKQGYKTPSARDLVKTWLLELKKTQEYPETF